MIASTLPSSFGGGINATIGSTAKGMEKSITRVRAKVGVKGNAIMSAFCKRIPYYYV